MGGLQLEKYFHFLEAQNQSDGKTLENFSRSLRILWLSYEEAEQSASELANFPPISQNGENNITKAFPDKFSPIPPNQLPTHPSRQPKCSRYNYIMYNYYSLVRY